MAYNKYKKVRATQGVINLNKYISDSEKTAFSSDENPNSDYMKAISDYIENDMKTINPENMQHLVSVINCQSADTFVDECEDLEKLYHAAKSERLNKGCSAVHAYHIINSFKGTDIDPEIVHQAGIDLARALCGEDFAAKICTHLNTDNYHNHIVINAYSNDASRKFKDEFHFYEKIRTLSDEIARTYGLEIMENTGSERKSISELLEKWEPQKGIKSKYREMKEDIKQCQKLSISFDDFKSKMRMAGYELREEQDNLIFSKDGFQASSRSLGTRYYKESITTQINASLDWQERNRLKRILSQDARKLAGNWAVIPIRVPKYDSSGRRVPWIIRFLQLVLKYLQYFGNQYIDADAAAKYPNNPSLVYVNDKVYFVKQAMAVLEQYQIHSISGLDVFTSQAGYQLRTSQHNIAQISGILEKVDSVLAEIEKEAFFKKLLEDEHINPDTLEPIKVTPDDKKRCLAALDPIQPRQKMQLWNTLQDSGFTLKDKMDMLSRTDAERLLSFLREPGDCIPDNLMKKEEYLREKAINRLKLRSADWVKQLEDRRGTEEATEKQKFALKKHLSPEQYERISNQKVTKAMAARVLACTVPKPKIGTHSEAEFVTPSKWMIRTLEDIKLAFPDDFLSGEDFHHIHKEDANNLIAYYLAKFDQPLKPSGKIREGTNEPNGNQEKTVLSLDNLPEELRSIGNAYLEIQKIKRSFGIDTAEGIAEFMHLREVLSEKILRLEENSKATNALYQTLKKTQETLKRCDSKMFLCGPLFGGNDNFIKDAVNDLGPDEPDVLSDLIHTLPDILEKSLLADTEQSSLSSKVFIPPDPEVILYLTKLHTSVPEAFVTSQGEPISVRLLSSYEAAQFLRKLNESDYLTAKYRSLVENESRPRDNGTQKRF